MRVIPKKTKHVYSFRNKIESTKYIKYHAAYGGAPAAHKHFVNGWLTHTGQNIQGHVLPNNFRPHTYTQRLLFGHCAIQFQQHGTLSAKFIQTVNLDIAKMLKKKSRVWLRVCCDTPVTARPVETRMGKGKGAISYWEAKVYPGMLFFEFSGITREKANTILRCLQQKSPVRLSLLTDNA